MSSKRAPKFVRRVYGLDYLNVNEYQNPDGTKFLVFTTLGTQSMSPKQVLALTAALAEWAQKEGISVAAALDAYNRADVQLTKELSDALECVPSLCTNCGELSPLPGFTECFLCLGEHDEAKVEEMGAEDEDMRKTSWSIVVEAQRAYDKEMREYYNEVDPIDEDMRANGYTEFSEEG